MRGWGWIALGIVLLLQISLSGETKHFKFQLASRFTPQIIALYLLAWMLWWSAWQ